MTRRSIATSKSKLGNCDKCLIQTPAVTEQDVAFGQGKYRLRLCDRHADEMLDRFFEWARLGRLIEDGDSATIKPLPKADAPRRRGTGRVLRRVEPQLELPAIVTVASEEEAEVKAPRMIHPRRENQPVNAGRWRWSIHAEERFEERTAIAVKAGMDPITKDDVLWCAEHPDVRRPGGEEYPDCLIHIRGFVHVVVDPDRFAIVTVIDRRITPEIKEELQRA